MGRTGVNVRDERILEHDVRSRNEVLAREELADESTLVAEVCKHYGGAG